MSGLKINYHKSEVVVFGVNTEEEQRIANMLNSKVGKLPMKYLGVPVSDHHLGVYAFDSLPIKIGKRLQPLEGETYVFRRESDLVKYFSGKHSYLYNGYLSPKRMNTSKNGQ